MSTEQRRALAGTIPTTEVIKDAVTFPRDRLGEPLDISPERFEAWLRSVRRDAVQQFIEACRGKLDEPGFLLPPNHWEDIEAAIRVAESYVKNYPEETP